MRTLHQNFNRHMNTTMRPSPPMSDDFIFPVFPRPITWSTQTPSRRMPWPLASHFLEWERNARNVLPAVSNRLYTAIDIHTMNGRVYHETRHYDATKGLVSIQSSGWSEAVPEP